jgi:hypothetical protein
MSPPHYMNAHVSLRSLEPLCLPFAPDVPKRPYLPVPPFPAHSMQ